MSTFFSEDTVTFRADPHITGTIEQTWSDVDSTETSEALINCYIHKGLPSKARKAWFSDERLLPGYVIVAFMQPYDGYCLVSEQSLFLVDRSLALGDVVKKSPSDAQSGTVISTSLMCSLEPLCNEKEYSKRHQMPVQGHYPSHGSHAPKNGQISHSDELLHGFPPSDSLGHYPNLSPIDDQLSSLQVSARELTHWNNYREADFIIYKNWVGQVKSIYDEVTVRLGNGSVVVVEDPDELEEPYYIPGTGSHELVQRLDRAGFYKYSPRKNAPVFGKPQTYPTDTCYPGQHVQTKKGNLRRGQWKFGAYDPNVLPRGIVVDVRCIQLEVKWLYPNQSISLRGQSAPPADLLDTDELNCAAVRVYNRSRVPKYLTVDQLPNASYGPDTGFGNRVRFADPAGAAVKYGLVPVAPDILGAPIKSTDDVSTIGTLSFSPAISTCQTFDKIPRAATQGFDLNVLQVTGTSTKAMIRWQDRTITEEESIELYPYLNVDEHDVWPGEKISFKPDEEQLSESSPSAVRVHKAGVVQSVDAVGRIANVRWYEGAQIDIAANDDATRWQFSGLWHGKLGAETSKVPLYDITAYSAMNMTRGDGAIIMPKPQLLANQGMRASGLLSASLGRAIGLLGIPSYQSRSNTHSTELYSPSRPSTAYDSSEIDSENIDWCGEILDLCLDGEVIVRLGAAAEVRDIKVPPERILVVGLEDVDDGSEDDDDDESNLSDQMSVDDMNTDHDTDIESPEVLSVSVEYDGEMPVDADNDDSMWTTDEEIESADMYVTSEPEASDPAIEPTLGNRAATIESNLFQKRGCSSTDRHVAFSRYPSMPSQLEVLAGTPTDHHFHNSPCRLTGPVIRRIMRENEIMRRSLPDGVFVRAWDSRLDLLRVLIVGPHDTPYEFAPFVVDLQFGPNFPTSPPDIFFHSWTGNLGRINPNLYEDGKICLSLLGTWDADDKNEAWSPKDSTILQIIVSLMGLVLVKEPYYNEAGFDVLIGSADSRIPSELYTEKVYVLSKAFIKTALLLPPEGLDGVIKWLYLTSPEPGPRLLRRVVEDSEALLPESHAANAIDEARSQTNESAPGTTKLSAGALILLRRNLVWLKDCLDSDERQT